MRSDHALSVWFGGYGMVRWEGIFTFSATSRPYSQQKSNDGRHKSVGQDSGPEAWGRSIGDTKEQAVESKGGHSRSRYTKKIN